MRQTCIVTGGAGFIGCAISSNLVKQFDRVIAIDNLHPQIHPSHIWPRALHSSVEAKGIGGCYSEFHLGCTGLQIIGQKPLSTWLRKLVQANLLPKGRGTQMSTFSERRVCFTSWRATTVSHRRWLLSSSRAIYGRRGLEEQNVRTHEGSGSTLEGPA